MIYNILSLEKIVKPPRSPRKNSRKPVLPVVLKIVMKVSSL
jgi:hypothetical protein